MYYKITALVIGSLLLLAGCSDSTTEKTPETATKEPVKILQKAEAARAPIEEIVVKQDYTIEEIYNAMCIQCHSSDGTGNTEKLTPSMATLSQQEMLEALKEVEADQGHVVMEHNRGEIIKMGMEYSAGDMAKYMYDRFNAESK